MNTSEEIFRERFLPLYPRLFAAANAILGNRDDAADAVQDAMVKIWNRANELQAIASPIGFALQLVKTSAIDILRQRRLTAVKQPDFVEPAAEPAAEPDTSDFMRRAIATLPAGQQEAIRLSAFAGMDSDDIAETMGLSKVNVRQLLSRGRRKLREIYQKNM